MEWLDWLDKEDKYSGMTAKQRKIQESIDSENDSDNQYYTKTAGETVFKEISLKLDLMKDLNTRDSRSLVPTIPKTEDQEFQEQSTSARMGSQHNGLDYANTPTTGSSPKGTGSSKQKLDTWQGGQEDSEYRKITNPEYTDDGKGMYDVQSAPSRKRGTPKVDPRMRKQDPIKTIPKTASWESWLDKNNGIETSHKEGEKKEEWDGKFSSSTIRDDAENDDDKAVSEEESLEELTDGKLEEIEKLKSWEVFLEKGDGGHFSRPSKPAEAPKLIGHNKPTYTTLDGSREVQNDDKQITGKGVGTLHMVNGVMVPRKAEDVTVSNTIPSPKKNNVSTSKKLTDSVSPEKVQEHQNNISSDNAQLSDDDPDKLQFNTRNVGVTSWNKDGKYSGDLPKDDTGTDTKNLGANTTEHKGLPAQDSNNKFLNNEKQSYNATPEGKRYNAKQAWQKAKEEKKPRDEIARLKAAYDKVKNIKKSWESWLEKNEKWDREEKEGHPNEFMPSNEGYQHAMDTWRGEEGKRNSTVFEEEENEPNAFKRGHNFTRKLPKYQKGEKMESTIPELIADEKNHLNLEVAHSMKSWELFLKKGIKYKDPDPKEIDPKKIMQNAGNPIKEITLTPDMKKKSWEEWVEKMQGAGDARYGNQHLTGMEQHPVADDESMELSAETDENSEKQEEKEDKEDKDNKPYKALSQE